MDICPLWELLNAGAVADFSIFWYVLLYHRPGLYAPSIPQTHPFAHSFESHRQHARMRAEAGQMAHLLLYVVSSPLEPRLTQGLEVSSADPLQPSAIHP
jgi:hypothetical protein